MLNKLDCLSLAEPYQPWLMFVGKAGAYLKGKHLIGAPFRVGCLDNLTKIGSAC
jgi:hypothetical protein